MDHWIVGVMEVLECWSNGMMKCSPILQYSNNPSIHYSKDTETNKT
jgi:hypothetical protein